MRRGPVALVASLGAAAVLLPVGAAAQDPAPLTTVESTADRSAEPTGSLLTVTNVDVATYGGFDRVTFEIAGEGEPGWRIGYDDAPVSDGSGLPVEVAGAAALRVVLIGIALPDDVPEGAATFLDDVPGPAGGIVREVVSDSIFEGQRTFFVGLDEEVPFRLARLPDPTRVVIDLVHTDGVEAPDDTDDDTDEEAVPDGAVAAGLGGAADGRPLATAVLVSAVLLLAVGLALLVRRRPVA
jgi:hypothetical protein